jgi:hypothetical protein
MMVTYQLPAPAIITHSTPKNGLAGANACGLCRSGEFRDNAVKNKLDELVKNRF